MNIGPTMVLGSAVDLLAAFLFLALLLSWWGLLAWWIGRYGARDVSAQFRSSIPPGQALRDWRDYYGIWLAGAGYQVVDERMERIAFVGRYRPRWEIAVAVLFFPIGLLALLGTKPAHLVVTATGSAITVEGTMHRRMAKELDRDTRTISFDSPGTATPAASLG